VIISPSPGVILRETHQDGAWVEVDILVGETSGVGALVGVGVAGVSAFPSQWRLSSPFLLPLSGPGELRFPPGRKNGITRMDGTVCFDDASFDCPCTFAFACRSFLQKSTVKRPLLEILQPSSIFNRRLDRPLSDCPVASRTNGEGQRCDGRRISYP
jgi:hypothetical protein